MTKIRLPFYNGNFYHVYNRTVAKEHAFAFDRFIEHAVNTINFYRYPHRLKFSEYRRLSPQEKSKYLNSTGAKEPLVEIYAFSLMPNHFHLQIKQIQTGGVNRFISNFENSYAKYYNTVKRRVGSLFQDRFKSKRIKNNEEFIHVSRYIHLNPVTSGMVSYENLSSYAATSYKWYKYPYLNKFITSDLILSHFRSFEKYDEFMRNQVKYQITLKTIRDLLID